MHAIDHAAPTFRWTPAQLADAVPLRLSTLFAYTAARDAAHGPANTPRRARRAPGYLPAEALAPRFRVS
ncbi:MAG TPA: hypothetical protein VGE33_05775 [Thermomonas sp.]